MAPVVTLPFLRSHPRWSPRWGLYGACSLWARSCGSSRTFVPLPPHPAAVFSGGGVRIPLPSSPLSPLSSSLCSTHVAGVTQARRKHRARLQRRGEGGGFPFGAPISPWSGSSPASPAGPCHPGLPVRRGFGPRLLAFSLWRVGMLCSWLLFFLFSRRQSLPLARRFVLCPPPCPLATPSLSLPLSLVGGGVGGGGGGGALAVLPPAYARRRHGAGTWRGTCPSAGERGMPRGPRRRPSHSAFAPPVPPPLGLARRVLPSGTVVWSVPHPLPAASPSFRFVFRRGGRCPPLPTFIPHHWGGGGVWGGGGLVVFPSLQTCHRHDASTALARGAAPVPLQGGGACLAAPVVALSTLRLHPRWSPRRGMHGACHLRARSCGPSCTLLPLPPYPAALSSGGGSLFAPPLPAFPALGGAGVSGGGGGAPMSSPLRCTHVAGITQARHKHGVRHSAAAGGGGFPFGPSCPSPWYRLRTPGSPAVVAPRR